MSDMKALQEQYEQVKSMGLALNMQRGQPSDADFDLSNKMLTIVDETDLGREVVAQVVDVVEVRDQLREIAVEHVLAGLHIIRNYLSHLDLSSVI